MKSNQPLNSKLNIDEPLKTIKCIDFLFFSFVLGLIDYCYCSSWILAYLPAIALKAAVTPAAVLTLSDMTSDAQTPLAHAAMLHDTYGGTSVFQWHVSLKPVTHVNGLRLVSLKLSWCVSHLW